jgi:hypothetical protein
MIHNACVRTCCWPQLAFHGCALNNISVSMRVADRRTSSLQMVSSEWQHAIGGVQLAEGGEGAALLFLDTVIANHTGSLVACADPAEGSTHL